MPESRGAVPSLPAALDAQGLFRSLFAAYPDALIVADSKGMIVLANPAAAELLRYPIDGLLGLNVDALVPDGIRPRHESFRQAYARNPIPRPMGSQVELVAKRRDGTDVMVEIALSPLQDHGLPLVVAAIRDISAYPRVQQAMRRARYSEFVTQLGRAAVDALDPQVLFERLPGICAEALHVDVVRVFLLESNRFEFRVAAGVGAVPGEEVGMRVANRVDTPPGFVVQYGKPVFVENYASERRFAVPPAYLQLGLTSSLAVPLSDRGRPIGTLSVRSREPRRFGVEELRFLESLANLLAASLQRAQSRSIYLVDLADDAPRLKRDLLTFHGESVLPEASLWERACRVARIGAVKTLLRRAPSSRRACASTIACALFEESNRDIDSNH